MVEDELDVLGMLIRHELAIKELYEIFATTFSNHASFWRNLARDEQRHADRLSALRSEPMAGKWLLYGSRLKPQAIKTSIRYVETQISRAQKGAFSILQALSVARDLESALLERHFSKLEPSAPDEIRPLLKSLAHETGRHLETIVEMLVSEKRRSP